MTLAEFIEARLSEDQAGRLAGWRERFARWLYLVISGQQYFPGDDDD